MPRIAGGCLCGAVRYRSQAEPVMQVICHCGPIMTRPRLRWASLAQAHMPPPLAGPHGHEPVAEAQEGLVQ